MTVSFVVDIAVPFEPKDAPRQFVAGDALRDCLINFRQFFREKRAGLRQFQR